MKRLLVDIENDGLLRETTKVHCIAAIDADTSELIGSWGPHEIPQALEVLDKADVLIGHNIQSHDIPVLTKLHRFTPRKFPALCDTYISSRVIHPNIAETDTELVRLPTHLIGSHSLEAWGYRIGQRKAAYDGGWSEWSQEMQDYMVQDVRTNKALWDFLKVDSYSPAAIELEHRIALITNAIQDAGVPFDIPRARTLEAELRGKIVETGDALRKQFKAWFAPVSPEMGPWIEGGKTPTRALFTPKVTRGDYIAGRPFTKIKQVHFNPGSRHHIARVLRKRGWKPTEFTEKGSPKIDEQIVNNICLQFPEMAGLGDYLMLKKRVSQLADGEAAWLKTVAEDGRIHGAINPMGTATSRGAHFAPNLGQVPAAASPYGPECRALFYAPPGWKLVGADMEGLELRGLSHYLYPHDSGAYSEKVLHGDPHWANTVSMGLASGERDKHSTLHTVMREQGAKRFVYAFVYGCGAVKAGQIVLEACLQAQRQGFPAPLAKFFGDSTTDEEALKTVGQKIRNAFLRRTAGLEDLKRKITKQVQKHKYVPGLDGRRVPVRSEHSALNFLIQSAGAILCKRWLCDAWDELCATYRLGWDGDFVYVLWVHDEVQVACREGLEDEIGAVLVKHARSAGVPYSFRVPLDSKYKVGQTWADTH